MDAFAKLLVSRVRDVAIQNMDRGLQTARSGNKALWAKRWREAEKAGALPEVLIADCVDEVVFDLLAAIDSGVMRLQFTDDSGKRIDLGESEELGGWYMMADSPESWRARFSSQRIEPTVPKSKKPEGTKPHPKKKR